ncbi:hypothetical protein KPL71_004797 [Citrus sinensis]|uniref:Uncharacterized protein n=1 Tax=Citrus sinensis TaxID=2711 RepID=A0ACB8N8D6_CITSI|nr:hypothetical protein KPL71_004797 [Citrus sinensis]
MPAELSNLENSDPKAIIFWPRSPGEEVSKANKPDKIANKCTTESKGNAAAKKTCICAPTSHAGSFRCHLHRTNNAPPKLSSSSSRCLVDDNGRKSQPQLSRFYTCDSVQIQPAQNDKPVINAGEVVGVNIKLSLDN